MLFKLNHLAIDLFFYVSFELYNFFNYSSSIIKAFLFYFFIFYNSFIGIWGDKERKVKFKLISSFAIFYDVENPREFCNDIESILDEHGIWVCE